MSISNNRQLSIKLLVFGVTMMGFSTVPLYKRVVAGEEKKKQIGEMTPDGGLRMFDKDEIESREKDSWFTKIFGSEK